MRIIIESTSLTIKMKHSPTDPDDQAIICRLWQGATESGIPICCLIPHIAVNSDHDQTEFERELSQVSAPRSDFANVFPLRMIV